MDDSRPTDGGNSSARRTRRAQRDLKTRRRRRIRRLVTVVGVLALAIAVPFAVNHFSVEPGAAIMKSALEAGPPITPAPTTPGVVPVVSVDRDIPVPTPDAPAAALDVYHPSVPASAALPIVLLVHGGGFIAGSKESLMGYATLLAEQGYVVASLEYTLAPGSTHPTPVRQGNAALAYLSENAATWGGDATRMFIGGDSAGAQIASELASAETNPALADDIGITPGVLAANLRGAILFCGLYDMATVGDSGFPALRTYLWAYTGYREWTDSPDVDQLSTTTNITADYPPTFITVGDADPFESQATELAAALEAKGVAVTKVFWTGSGLNLGHEYQFDFSKPQAVEAFTKTLGFLAARSGAAPQGG